MTAVSIGFAPSFEFAMLDFIQAHMRSGANDFLMPWISRLGDGGVVWIILTAVLCLCPKTRMTGLALAIALAVEFVCCNLILKPVIARIRPCDVNTAAGLLIARPHDFSFPSGHTAAAFAAASALYFRGCYMWIFAAGLAVLIAYSRLYLYVHYPTDILGGAILGTAAGWIGYRIAAGIHSQRLS